LVAHITSVANSASADRHPCGEMSYLECFQVLTPSACVSCDANNACKPEAISTKDLHPVSQRTLQVGPCPPRAATFPFTDQRCVCDAYTCDARVPAQVISPFVQTTFYPCSTGALFQSMYATFSTYLALYCLPIKCIHWESLVATESPCCRLLQLLTVLSRVPGFSPGLCLTRLSHTTT
jgi:hypothetical protein